MARQGGVRRRIFKRAVGENLGLGLERNEKGGEKNTRMPAKTAGGGKRKMRKLPKKEE